MAKRPLSELKEVLKQKENQLLKSLVDVSYIMALNFKAYADHQIKNKGIPDESYSENPLPPIWLMNNAKSKAGRDAIEKKSKKGEVSYKDLRQVEGLQTQYVDFTFSGETLRAWGIIETKQIGNRYISFLGGTTEASKRKLRYGKSMYGNFWFRVVGSDGQKLLKSILEKEYTKIKNDLQL